MPTQTKPVLPFAPYEGSEPYIFVSYAHANKDKVYPIIKRLHEMGYRLWYDEGIEPGDEWPKVIGDHIIRSACMLLFLTPEAVVSEWVRKEIHTAISKTIKIIGTFLVDTDLPSSLFFQLSNVQMLKYDETYWDAICKGIPNATQEMQPILQKSVFMWLIDFEETATLVKYKGQASGVSIPGAYLGFPVLKIGRDAFRSNTQIRTVVVPDTVLAIEGWAFYGCHLLNHVTIPQSTVKIGTEAFVDCTSLTDIWLSSSAISIDWSAFRVATFPHNPALTFHCPRGSHAEQYAKLHGIRVDYTT